MAETGRSGALQGLRIVWLQSPPWDGLWTRQNHFSRRFAAEGAEILYVENPASFGQVIREGRATLKASVRRDVEPGLHVMSLPLQVPGSRTSALAGRINGAIFARSIRRWTAREGWHDPAWWCRLPVSVETLDRLPPGPVVYDVTDDYVHYARSGAERSLTAAREARLAQRAAQIFTTTAELAERLGAVNPNVRVVQNGVDPSFFDLPPGLEADPLPGVMRPRIGYVGLVAPWVDLELLAKIATRWPGQVVSIGPVRPECRAAYDTIPGLVRLAAIPNLDLPRYLRALDVCIQPNLPLEVRHRADPLKIVEYMSAGKPIVSTNLRSVRPLSDLVDLADGHDAFIAAIERRLDQPADAALSAARIERAKQRSWDNQYRIMRDCIAARVLDRDRRPQ